MAFAPPAMKSRSTLLRMTSSWHNRRFFFLGISYFFVLYLASVYADKQIGMIRLEHPYAELVASFKRNSGKGLSTELVELFRRHDRARHSRILAEVVQFPVDGSANPYVAGIYFTRVTLGNPPREYYVQVDTGSDLLWLNCNPCTACPRTNELGMTLVPYDPATSLSSSPISCESPICNYALKVANTRCVLGEKCGYNFLYGDGSTTTGYLVSDTFVYTTVQPNNTVAHAATKIVFGCGYSQSGNLLTAQNVVDGIMGFGQSELSVVSQLHSQELTPGAFAHCLEGSEKGGGVLILGHVAEPNMVFTPLISSKPHYNVNLRGISVNGVALSVDASAYETNDVQGTIFDSGTTLAYLMEPAYVLFIDAIIKGAPNKAQLLSQQGTTCFVFSGSVDDAFPIVILHFKDADMKLTGTHYLIQQADNVNLPIWCVGWRPISSSAVGNSIQLTILGDIVLKDQLVLYDLENQRIGWTDFDCSKSISVSTTSGNKESVSPNSLGSSALAMKVQILWLVTLLLLEIYTQLI